ncbi:MAG: LPS export ABC transporter ATP-binding protein [Methylococcaceae bacterium TMED69]|nr:MAG: LPS export ABC transporter ATP-binding protein [Methylococcaceae bacterium TMED69]
MNREILEIKNLSKTYSSKQVVKDVSLDVCAGEIVGLLGPNGAGKTTSFYMIVGLIKGEKGTIYLGKNNITEFSLDERAKAGLGYLPQESSVFRKLNVEENILAVLELQSFKSEEERYSRLDELIDTFSLNSIRKTKGLSLSGGERRRVEIARTLACNPSFILLDEPFAGVDPVSVSEIQDIVEKLKASKIGVLITDHNVQETLRICDRAYVVSSGEIIAAGTAENILEDEKVRRVYLGESFKL